jgi:hypothetical protein
MTTILDDQIFEPSVIVLGVFGHTNKISEQDLQDNTLTLILQELGRIPDKVLIPSEGNSSIYIDSWAEALHIKTQVFQSDWARNGKIAQIIRDDRMAKECTHALVFLQAPRANEKTTKLEKFAEKLCKKGKMVFTSSHNQTLTQFEMSHCEPSLKALKPSRKSDKGKGQTLLKFQKKAEC